MMTGIARVLAMLQIARRELDRMQESLAHTVWAKGRIDAEKERIRLEKLAGYLREVAGELDVEEGTSEEPHAHRAS